VTQNKWVEQYFLIFVILGLFALVVSPFATPVVLGFFMALVVFPAHDSLERRMPKHPYLAGTISTILFTIIILLPLVFIGLGVFKEASNLVRQAGTFIQKFNFEDPFSLMGKVKGKFFDSMPFSEEDAIARLESFATVAGSRFAQAIAQFVSALPGIALDILIFLLSFYYALVDGKSLTRYLSQCFPFTRNEVDDLFSTTEKIARAVFVGSVAAGVAQGVVMGVAFAIFDVPGALLFGAVTAILSFVPLLGSGPTGIGGIIYLLAHGQKGAALGMAIALGLASVSDNLIKPLVLKGSFELHPLLGLISALGGLVVFGFVGLLLGPLFTALFVVILDMLRKRNTVQQLNDSF